MGEVILSVAFSTHLMIAGEFNNVHPRITYMSQSDYIVGAFYNSESQPSLFAGKVSRWQHIDFEYGMVSGYSGISVAPMVKANYNGFFLAPGYAKGDAGMIAGYEVKF